jgi:hypothetical protein
MMDAQSGGGGSGYSAVAGGVLETGSGPQPGNAADPERAGFGSPGVAGRVFFSCE